MTPDDIAALTAPAGRALLDSLPPYDADLAMRLSDDLRRRGVPPSLVAAALTQSRLRVRAHPKLGEFARTMLFTDTGLQQATRLTVAAHHARRLRDADLHHVADLTCGIGVDSMAMAALDLTVTAVDADPTTAAIAAHNLRHFPATRVIHGDGLSLDMDALGVDGIYADPSRRTSTGNRVFDPAAYSPPLDAILAHAKRRPLGLKVAPGIPHALLPPGTEAQWVSDAGTVVECTIWTGRLGRSGHPSGSDDVGGHAASAPRATRSALVLAAGHATEVVEGGGPRLGVGPLGDYLLEPNGAVIRASLIAEAAAMTGFTAARLIHPRIAYVTADTLGPAVHQATRVGDTSRASSSTSGITAGLFTAYRILDVLPYKIDMLRAYFRAKGVGDLAIKKRGVDADPDSLRRTLRLQGQERATAVLTRVEGRHSVIVVEPCLARRPQEH